MIASFFATRQKVNEPAIGEQFVDACLKSSEPLRLSPGFTPGNAAEEVGNSWRGDIRSLHVVRRRHRN